MSDRIPVSTLSSNGADAARRAGRTGRVTEIISRGKEVARIVPAEGPAIRPAVSDAPVQLSPLIDATPGVPISEELRRARG